MIHPINPTTPPKTSLSLNLSLDLELTKELVLFGDSLELSVTENGRGRDEFELHLLQVSSGGVHHQTLSEGEDSLLGTNNTSLDHQEIVGVSDTVVRPSTHGGDGLDGRVKVGGSGLLVTTFSNSVDLLVHLSSVVETILTSTGNREHDLRWMPRSDTSDFSQTLMRLSWQLLGTPSVSNTLETVTFGDTDDIDTLVLLEDAGHLETFLKVVLGKVDFVSDGTTVDLDLDEVGLLALEGGFSDLGVGKDSDDGAVFSDSLKLSGDGSAVGFRVFFGVFGESLLLRSVPVLVESPLHLVRQVLSPDGSQ